MRTPSHRDERDPCISVITPVYNAERFVERAVRSALDQPEVAEVLLIEDGSSDGSLEICRGLEAAHERVVLLRHPDGENRGAGASRNRGLEAARGEFIAFLDADDIYLPVRFEQDVDRLCADSEALGIFHAMGACELPEERRIDGRLTTLSGVPDRDRLFEQKMGIEAVKGSFSICALTVRSRAVRDVGPMNEDLRLHQDSEWISRLVLTGPLLAGQLDEPVALRGVHPGNRYLNNARRHQTNALFLQALLDWMIEHDIAVDRRRLVADYLRVLQTHLDPSIRGRIRVLSHLVRDPRLLRNMRFFFDVVDLFVRPDGFVNSRIRALAWKLYYGKHYT